MMTVTLQITVPQITVPLGTIQEEVGHHYLRRRLPTIDDQKYHVGLERSVEMIFVRTIIMLLILSIEGQPFRAGME